MTGRIRVPFISLNRLLDLYRATGMYGAMPDSVLREIDCLLLDEGHPGNKIQVGPYSTILGSVLYSARAQDGPQEMERN